MREIDLTKEDVIQQYQAELNRYKYDDVFEKYKDPATMYCRDVLDEKIITCNTIKLMAFRHLQDLRRITEDDDFDYYFDLKEAAKILNFSSLMIDISTGNPLKLMEWQKSLLLMINAWKSSKDNTKRFNKVIFSVARTNGKTAICAIQILYSYLIEMDNLTGQEAILVAPNNTQATKGFSYLQLQSNRLREIKAFDKLFKSKNIDVQTDQIISKKTQNKTLKLSFEAKRFDSLHPRIVVADEVADDLRQKLISDGLDKLSSGQVQIDSPQLIQISTAYPDSNCAFRKTEQIMIDAMKKDYERKLENTLCVIYEQDNVDEETSKPETWIKSNPILALPEVGDHLKENMLKERDSKEADGTLYSWQNKNLNCWLNRSNNNYLELSDIEQSIVDKPPINIEGQDVYIGYDASNFSDDTSLSFVFPYVDDGVGKYYIYEHSFIPLARSQGRIDLKEQQDNIPYRAMEKKGFCSITKNAQGFINVDEVYNYLMNFISDNKLKVKCFVYDRWNTDTIIKKIEQNNDFPLLALQQTAPHLNDATKEFQRTIAEGRVTFLHDEVLTTALTNAVLVVSNGFVKIDKDAATKKIDVADAIIDAFERARYYFDNINFDKDKNNPFSGMDDDEINDYFMNEFSF
ncbi:terminase TerL endonuclease subunit [Ligilactobacillus sp. LYQ135]